MLSTGGQAPADPKRLDRIRGTPLASRSDLIVRLVECDSPDFAVLSSSLDAELEARYPGLGEGDTAPAQDLVAVVVAYRGDASVGCGALRELEPGVGEIKRMFVLPEARRLGAARRMLEALEMRARELDYSALRLGSGVRQPEAMALYESRGYRRVPLFGEYEGATLCVCYEKSLVREAC
jgi:putative acetyltransferase